ncbi:ABC transporter permease [Halolactibacillus alkaliphilus]|uniref:ABC transporter permease n=1 Tax=Halolactibacillus alkaliphilus TaxID=442899 RepID=A0A511X1B1_9BACI|nr:sugar ABC transporter permease [Halolactibacillus alkaliphilus]GEN56742.1 ABC transporter permease [Halolactibacillus alkaliphilus]GGN70873.1 ABC transporter permease [Halolactibacillus alkaliphilus]SFO79992.1 ABC-type sugar transport system, permease component [Halolactibacillus alkaliphilus]
MKLKRETVYGYMFILPWLIGFLILVLYPMIQSFYYSLNNMRITPTGLRFIYVGFNNYRDVWLQDMFFITELFSFSVDTLIRIPVIVVFALVIAMLLNQDVKMKGLFRTIFFLPVIVASGPVINQLVEQGATAIPMLNQDIIMNILTSFLPMWFAEVVGNLFNQIITILWYSGVQILLFLASLQKIDPNLYEAAKIDGGSNWECFWKITLPTIKPIILINLVYTLISLANSGQNPIIDLIYANMFNATRGYGFASAMAWMYAVIIGLMLLIIFLIFKEKKPARG